MTELIYTIHSFNSLKSVLVVEKARKKKFSFFLFLYILFSMSKISIREKKIFKRQVVVLKSPFHYKLPKHHLMYNFFIVTCKCEIPTVLAEALIHASTSAFFLVNVTKLRIGSPAKLSLEDLIL